MKNNAAQREFKKYKSQINQIEEIVEHSKPGALIEHESAIRKKLVKLKELENQNLRDYKEVYERYEELLEDISKKILDQYNKSNNTEFDFYEVIRGNYNSFLNQGIMTILTKLHIPKLVAKEFEENFPKNPKDEYLIARSMKRKFYIHLGDTNTGKTYNALQRLKSAKKGVYLSPLRILALENYERLNSEGVLCNLMTGEEEIINEAATHTSCTIEKVNLREHYEIAVIDEIQMISDPFRGMAWSKAVLGLQCDEIHICGAANAKYILETIIKDCKDDFEIKEYTRAIPLEVEFKNFSYNDIQEGDAIVVFSKKRVLEIAEEYSSRGIKASVIYGDLPPEVRKMQYTQFVNKETKILVTTDAIGMGVNLPIRRIIFMSIRKFDGEEVRELTSQEIKQVGGRAGRIGIYDVGYIASVGGNASVIKDKLEIEDQVIQQAVIGPTEAILKIKSLPLNEKLALWSTREEKMDYYTKMDVSEYLLILDKIKNYKLSEEIQWDLLKVPFDVSSDELMNTFLDYVDELFINKQEELFKPQCFKGSLDDLEIYYQKINMYYSFSKIFNLKFDPKWVYDERIKVSEEINEILLGI
ncbi:MULTISPECIES: helicase-related protein [Clostridium]|uniref:RNA helicase n=1 Tax=Clostridium saccharoperbutylacetonicum N1-4(HMT) TaxID=931276 RepID=M1LT98_9CLOT|nr:MULTISPECIES: helicase-related protein [Clostridium]AGF56235.1 superfamily II DNA and RNA helicase [Clostridium saccharoperbutylacetonicum N1-4(HMT)]AQR94975.1 ATP-dependent RNA helicase DeaD [Clostridium saccharoperbutylacetonicum]NRT63022.1 ATP-dependent RNA helicase SUPV3L1/SUV3 [Clostridium saccharoperbutylacetonicum]NSB26379.1 ATP-dependent RNA helicase SUPV3L1/SUV3 [Clostridium saccharoperbutylacetonicum]NSB30818.1 ATP-dependent RNA helicase SUPV3L1/SUV3 [Clostridium saccharoperbutyla